MAHETDLADAYYEVIKRIPNNDWFQFARQGLRLEESDIDDISHDYPNNVREKEFRMCKRWERNVEGQASAKRIFEIMEKFLTGEPSETHQNKEPTDENNAIVIICDETIKEKAEDSKRILEDEGHVVYLNVGTSPSRQLMHAMYKIYLVSKSTNVDKHVPMLTESSPNNVLVIVRQNRRKVIPACLERFTVHCIKKKLTSKLIAEFISQFVQGNLKNEDSVVAIPSTSLDVRRAEHDELATTSNKNPHGISVKGGDFRGSNLGCSVTKEGGSLLHSEGTEKEPQIIEGGSTSPKTSSSGSEEDEIPINPELFNMYETELKSLNILKFPEKQKKHALVLVVSSVQDRVPHLSSLASIPWMQVFDFDPKSRITGLLSSLEPTLETSLRYFTISDSDKMVDSDKMAEVANERITNWIFLRGICDVKGAVLPEASNVSKRLVKVHCDSLIKCCTGRKVPCVVVLWYSSNTNNDKNLDIFLSALQYELESSLGSFKCIICVPTKINSKTPIGRMLQRLELERNVSVIPFEVLCAWLKSETDGRLKNKSCGGIAGTFPRFSEEGENTDTFDIGIRDYSWLEVCFSIITSTDEPSSRQDINERGEDFLKGGNLDWDVIASQKYDAERDVLREKKNFIKDQFIKTAKSGIISIYHSPGSGGSTFARRLLWELKKDAPCLELKPEEFPVEEIKQRLNFIRNETHLPVVLLIDGNSTHDPKMLSEFCRYERLVILHVQRAYTLQQSAAVKQKEVIFLPEKLSPKEADSLLNIFSSVKPKSRINLESLTEGVRRGESHDVIEYGLTAYESEFHGVKRYVHGNLQINQQTKLEIWHDILAYLSLANYYGHCKLPCKLFGALLEKKSQDIVQISDIPPLGRKFISQTENGEWGIFHFTVAKEILEQVLVKRSQPEYESKENFLSDQACLGLCNLAISFLDFIKDNLYLSSYIPNHIKNILTWMFISRNYKNTTEKDNYEGSRGNYKERSNLRHSRLVEDTKHSINKQRILEKLAENFPSHADFQAHLGRFFAKTDAKKARECFDAAIQVRNREISEKSTLYGDSSMCRIHHMYGSFLSGLIRDEIIHYNDDGKFSRVDTVLDLAEQAIAHFGKSRVYYQKGCNASYMYIGEIKMRLNISEFEHKMDKGNVRVTTFDDSLKKLKKFVLDSFSRCDELIAACLYHSGRRDIPRGEIETCQNRYNSFYQNTETALKAWVGQDKTVYSKRCHLSILKIEVTKKKQKHGFSIYEDVTNLSYIDKFIEMYEGIFRDVETQNLNTLVSNYMREWLQAIRHPALLRALKADTRGQRKRYTLVDVQSMVEQWDQRKERGSLSTYYNYVIATMLAICGKGSEISNEHSQKAQELKNNLHRNSAMIPDHLAEKSMEWFGNCNDSQDFQNLVNVNVLGKWDGRFFSSEEKISLLRVCTGTVYSCKIHQGQIKLDVRHTPQIFIFFIPQRYGFRSSLEKRPRVEFYLGFNPRHGAEAFQVKMLDKKVCTFCKTPTEIAKLGKPKSLWKASCPRCGKQVRG